MAMLFNKYNMKLLFHSSEQQNNTYNKEHLSTILMGQYKQSENSRHWDFIIECFTMQLEEGMVYLDIVTTTVEQRYRNKLFMDY